MSDSMIEGGWTVAARRRWPPSWEWALELTPHLLKRMVDRRFTEVDLREMLEGAAGYRPDHRGGTLRDRLPSPEEEVGDHRRAGCGCEAAGGRHSISDGKVKI